MRKNKFIEISKLLVVNFMVLLFLLGVCEIGLRMIGHQPYSKNKNKAAIEVSPGGSYFIKDSLLGYTHKAGQYKVKLKGIYEFTTTHNENTFRITSAEKIVGKPEIWMFGCSFTHGWSLNDEETFPFLVQTALKNYKIINFGVSGYGTIHFYLQLKHLLEGDQKPALVIINHGDFHFERNTFSYRRRRAVSNWNFLGTLNQPYVSLDESQKLQFHHSDFDYQPHYFSNYSALAYYINRKIEQYIDKKEKPQEQLATSFILDETVRLCQQYKVQLILSNIYNYPDSNFLKNYSSKRKVPFVDIALDFANSEHMNLPYDDHPSPKANQIYAARLLTFLNDFLN